MTVKEEYVIDENMLNYICALCNDGLIYEDKYVNAKATSSNSSSGDDYDDGDEEYEMCREFVIQAQKASTSLLQRKFRIGYNKAARIIDQLEEDGVIGPQLGSKPREVFIRQYHEEDL